MHLLDLFSGIGGFAYATQLANLPIENHYYSDVAPYANQVYSKHFPDAIPLGDIRNIEGYHLRNNHPGEWLLTGGFPCQDISIRGQNKGIKGERSGLWYEMLRVIDELKPRYVLAENVAALTYRGLDTVLQSLAEIGYDAEWQVVSAAQVGAPHKRERIWIIAYPSDSASGGCGKWMVQLPIFGRNMGEVQDASASIETPLPWTDWQRDITARQMAGQPLVCRKDHGISQWVDRNIVLGNAIVPQVAASILRLLPMA